jgi:hypothetical protein
LCWVKLPTAARLARSRHPPAWRIRDSHRSGDCGITPYDCLGRAPHCFTSSCVASGAPSNAVLQACGRRGRAYLGLPAYETRFATETVAQERDDVLQRLMGECRGSMLAYAADAPSSRSLRCIVTRRQFLRTFPRCCPLSTAPCLTLRHSVLAALPTLIPRPLEGTRAAFGSITVLTSHEQLLA